MWYKFNDVIQKAFCIYCWWLAGAIYMAWLTFYTKEIGNFSIACKISILIIYILNIISCTRFFRVRIPMYSTTSQFTFLGTRNFPWIGNRELKLWSLTTPNSRNYKLNLSQFTVFPIYSIVNWEENRELEVLLHRYKTVNLRG